VILAIYRMPNVFQNSAGYVRQGGRSHSTPSLKPLYRTALRDSQIS
jgi:hypothetical protein